MDIVRINIKTGEGYCRIFEFWEAERVTSSLVHLETAGTKEGREDASSVPEIPDNLPGSLKVKLKVIIYNSQGFGNQDISKMIGVPMLRIGHILRWKEQIILQARAIEQYMEGKTVHQVAQGLNLAPEWVKSVIRRYDINRVISDAAS